MERAMGLEPTTTCLGSRSSTTELRPHLSPLAALPATLPSLMRCCPGLRRRLAREYDTPSYCSIKSLVLRHDLSRTAPTSHSSNVIISIVLLYQVTRPAPSSPSYCSIKSLVQRHHLSRAALSSHSSSAIISVVLHHHFAPPCVSILPRDRNGGPKHVGLLRRFALSLRLPAQRARGRRP